MMEPWQMARFGAAKHAELALDYFRKRNWPVDDRNMSESLEGRIYAFISGYEIALNLRRGD